MAAAIPAIIALVAAGVSGAVQMDASRKATNQAEDAARAQQEANAAALAQQKKQSEDAAAATAAQKAADDAAAAKAAQEEADKTAAATLLTNRKKVAILESQKNENPTGAAGVLGTATVAKKTLLG